MPRDSVVSPTTPGAARRESYSYPANGRTTVNNVPLGTDLTGRPNGVPSASAFNVTDTGAPPAPRGSTIYKGRVSWAITSSAATGTVLTPNFGGVNRPLIMPFQEVKGPVNTGIGVDVYACWSVSAILAFDQVTGVVTGDLGVAVGVGTRAAIRGASQFAGMEIGPRDVGSVGVVVRQTDGGAITFDQATPLQPDITEYHLYEIRLISATDTNEARAKFLIDGLLQFSISFGAGTVLPPQVVGGAGNIGNTPGLINLRATAGTSRMYLANNGLAVKCAPTEEALL